ncbi:MAG: T9SS type A sorting domain-containing protein [Muribaculaceae bacterium]
MTSEDGAAKNISFLAEGTNTTGEPTVTFSARGNEMTTSITSKGGNKYDVAITWTPKGYVDPAEVIDAYVKMPGCNDTKTVKLRLYYQKPATGGLTLEAIGGSIENVNGWRTWLSATSSNPQWVNNGRVVKEFNVRGSGLVGDIKLSVSPQGSYGLTVYPLTLPATGGKVTVIYSPKVGDVTGNNPVLTISNSNASPVTVALKTSWDKSTVAKVPALPTIKDGAFTPNIYECKTYKGRTTVSLRWELVNPDNIRLHVYSQTDINNESNADTKARMIEWNKIYNANTAFTYDVYRDGKLIVKELDITSYVDMNVSAGTSDKPIEHTYYVVAHYGNGNTKESGVKSVKLYRDMAISQYVLEEEYNYPIVNQETWNNMGQPADCFKAWGNDNGIHRESFLYKFNSAGTGDPYDTSKNKASGAPGDGVRQGVFYNGKWYIALVTDREAVGTADTKPNAIAIYGGMKDGEHGHILEIDAAKGVLNTTQVKSFQQLHTMTNQSLAVTSDGRFYFRADKENNVNGTTVAGDRYLDPIQSFGFYKSQYAKNLRWDDVMGLKAEADKHNKATETVNGEVRPLDSYIATQYYRTHYMAARGKLTSNGSDPIKLCFAQNYSHDAYIIDMQDGWGDTGGLPNGTWHKLSAPRQVVTHRDGQERIIDIAAGTENYIFPVEGEPNKYIHVMRSSGIFLVDVTDINNPVYTLISSDQSEVTSASGLTFTLENSMAKSTDLFYIHATSVHSNNTGHFRIDMPQRSKDGSGNYVGDIHTADFTDMVPMASKLQEEIPGFEAGNSNGMWFGVQDGEENGIKVKYIYQYVPGVRFAKYKFYPVQAFPPAQPNIDVVIRHDDPNMDATPHQADDITHFDVTYSWKRPANFGTLQGAAKNFKIDGYNVQLLDPNGNVIPGTQRFEKAKDGEDDYTVYGPFVYNQHAKPGSGNKNDFRPENGFNKDNAPGKGLFDVHDGKYTVNVTPVYVPTNTASTNRYTGETGVAQDDADYTPQIYNIRAKLWQDAKAGIYRVDIDFNRAPRSDDETNANTIAEGYEKVYTYRRSDQDANANLYKLAEPASRFKIQVSKDGGVHWQDIPNLRIVYGGNVLLNPAAEQAEIDRIETNHQQHGGNKNYATHDGYVKHDYDFGGNFLRPNGRSNVKARASQEAKPGDKMYAQEAMTLLYGGDPANDTKTQNIVATEKSKGAFRVVAFHLVDAKDAANIQSWKYRATALYADNQPYESIKRQASVETEVGEPTPTGVDDVTADAENGGVHIWPVPAESELHIAAPEAIESVSIFNVSGACVASFDGNGDTAMTVSVDSLASGVYFVKVNGNVAQRLIKR